MSVKMSTTSNGNIHNNVMYVPHNKNVVWCKIYPGSPEPGELNYQITSGHDMSTPEVGLWIPFVCPVCGGRGTVSRGFYDWAEVAATTAATSEMCRSCGSTGIVWRDKSC